MTIPAAPAATSVSMTAPRAPAWLVTMSTTGHCAGSSVRTSAACSGASGQGLKVRSAPFSTSASTPASPELKASTRQPCSLRRSAAACTRPASTTSTPRAPGPRATVTASTRFCGPSADSAVAGRIAAVSTTGLDADTVRCRK